MICDLRQGGRVEVDGQPFLVDGKYLLWARRCRSTKPQTIVYFDPGTWRPVMVRSLMPGSKSITNRALPMRHWPRRSVPDRRAPQRRHPLYGGALNAWRAVEADESNDVSGSTVAAAAFPGAQRPISISAMPARASAFLTAALPSGRGTYGSTASAHAPAPDRCPCSRRSTTWAATPSARKAPAARRSCRSPMDSPEAALGSRRSEQSVSFPRF